MTITFRAGRKPPHPESTHPRVKFGAHLDAKALPAPPTSVDWHTEIAAWPMYGNSDWGDCVEAEIGHHEEVFTAYGAGALVEVADSDVLAVYEAVGGFDPNAGPPGNNPTDQGTNIQDALTYWVGTGIAGRKIAAFAQVDYKTDVEWQTALALFGPLSVGVNLPAVAQTQFSDGQPWDVVADDGGIEGGHCVALVGYDADFLYVVTWGAVQKVTRAWWAAYVEELWAPVSGEWVNAGTGADPEGVDLAGLGGEFADLTGLANPFPAPAPRPTPEPPTPTPTPTPAPIPSPDPNGLLAELAALIHAVKADAERGWDEIFTFLEQHGLKP